MKRTLILLGAGLLTLMLLAVAAAGVVLTVVDPNDYKEDISAAVSSATGRRLILQGDLSLALFPRPEIRSGAFRIEDQPDFGAEPFLSARSASLRLALGPLLGGRLEAEEIRLDGLRLKLAVSATGRKNWENSREGAGQAEGVEDLREEAKKEPSVELSARVLRLTGGEVFYRDLAEGISLRLGLDSLELRDAALNADMPLEVRGGLENLNAGSGVSFLLRGAARLGGDGTVSGKVEALNLKAGGNGPEAALAGNFAFAPGSLRAEMTGKAGDTSLRGQVDLALPGPRGPGLGIRGELSLGSLDLDALLAALDRLGSEDVAPDSPREGDSGARPAQPAAVRELPPALRALDADLRLSVNTLLAARLPLTLVSVQLKAEGGRAQIPYSLKLFQGTISGGAKADLRPAAPVLELDGEIRDLAVGDLLAAVSGKRTLSGRLSGDLSLRGRGLEAKALLSSLSGKGEAHVAGGEVQGFTLIPQDLPGVGPLPVNFPLERLSLALVLNRGLAEVKTLDLLSPLITSRGGGTANLATGALNLVARFRLAGASPEIPLRVGGTFARPTYGVDLAEMGKNAAEAVLEAPEDAAKTLRGLQRLLPGK
jgi:AsmA protein